MTTLSPSDECTVEILPPDAPVDLFALADAADPCLSAAQRTYHDASAATRVLIEDKRALLRQFDPAGMTRVAALCHYGRSGSLLLGSYFDAHPDVITLPRLASEHLYAFYERYPRLSIWEKLIAFPTFAARANTEEGDLFQVLDRAAYYAAVQALHAALGTHDRAWLDSSQCFFQLMHVAYALGTGRPPTNPQPLMLYAQHWPNEVLAAKLLADFPTARFVHAVRDPITAVDSWFDRQIELYLKSMDGHPELAASYLNPAAACLLTIIDWSHPQRGLAAISRAIRFEDMHLDPDGLMRQLEQWLGIAAKPGALSSTWNGQPYVVQAGGKSWVGPNPANTRRRWRNLNVFDRALLFALLHENFIAWKYPSPWLMRIWPLRLLVVVLLGWLPMKLEAANAGLVYRLQMKPAWKRGRYGFALRAPLFILGRRLRIGLGVAREAALRLLGRRRVLQLLD